MNKEQWIRVGLYYLHSINSLTRMDLSGLSIKGLYLILALYIATKSYNKLAYLRAKHINGCGDAPQYPHKDPIWGLDLFFAQQKAGQEEHWMPTSKRLFAEHGKTYEVIWLGQRMIHTMDPKNIQAAFANDAKSWGLQPLREGIAVPFFDHGINTTDGAFHQYSRSLVRPTFARRAVANLAFLEKHTDRLIAQLPKDGATFDLQPFFSCLFLDALTEFLFGESMDSLLPERRNEAELFINSFDYAMIGLGQRVRLGRLRFLHRDPKWHEAIRVVHAQVDRYIDNAFRQQASKGPGAEGDASSIEDEENRYILLHEMAKETQDRPDLRSQILTVFMPGRDSTGYALSNVFHVLARRPDIYQKLRSEVLGAGSEPLTFEHLKSLKYVQWVLNEGHRVYPTTTQAPRVCLQDTTLPTGGGADGRAPIFMRKGDHLMAGMWGLHQDEDIWGPDAGDFRPERWERARQVWTFIPFGGGPRTCPAQQMVLTQEAYVLVRLIRAFESIESKDPKPWTEARRIGFLSKYGVKVSMKPGRLT